MDFHNRRKFHRINFDGQANLKFNNGNNACCRIKDLSLTGMGVTGNFQLTQATNCQVKIFHGEKSGNNCLTVLAKIVWKKEREIGLKFKSMTLENYELLQATLSEKAEQPITIIKEFPHKYPYEVYLPN